jgi:hypothetical protein
VVISNLPSTTIRYPSQAETIIAKESSDVDVDVDINVIYDKPY